MTETVRHCPALLIAAPASGQGKTTVTAALARLHRWRGRQVRVFKTGADFLDPMLLATAAGAPCHQLDLFMGGEAHCRQLLFEAAGEADLILIEGVMGLFDGSPSSADLAQLFGVPVLAVVDAAAMAQTFAAVAHGLAHYRPALPFAGLVANGVAGAYHRELLAADLDAATPLLGSLPREAGFALPERQLGLARPDELADLDQRLNAVAQALAEQPLAELPAPVAFHAAGSGPLPPLLRGLRIAVARDVAFCFIYQANLDLLRALGAELRFFSPLAEARLPEADSLYLPGGQLELHLPALAANTALLSAVRAHHRAGRPLLAEGGGLLYLLEALTGADGARHRLTGVLPGEARIGSQLRALGPQRLALPEGELRGNSFHYATVTTSAPTVAHGVCPNGGPTAEPVYRQDRLTASSAQLYFPSNPEAIARLLLP